MILAGGYAIWYGRWELAVYDGDFGTDPVIDTMEDFRLRLVDVIDRVGAQRLAAIVIMIVAAVIATARLVHPTDVDRPAPTVRSSQES